MAYTSPLSGVWAFGFKAIHLLGRHSFWATNPVLVGFFFFLVGLGFELWALRLPSRNSTAWATPPVHFALVILEMGYCGLFAWVVLELLGILASQVARMHTGATGARLLMNIFNKEETGVSWAQLHTKVLSSALLHWNDQLYISIYSIYIYMNYIYVYR
jgi:hypothetical protein